jgi:aryl-alcohol dehydrogenase-like predicted oxidoreductase
MLPTIPFGGTDHKSSRCLFGAAALAEADPAAADRTLDVLLEHGVNHIDVAAGYGDAELRVGPWMSRHRDKFFLATKTGERTRRPAADQIRRSLERLQTDSVDLIQLHAVATFEELDTALGAGGALEAAREARERGLVRFIGITSHGLDAPTILRLAVERFPFASVLLPYNYPLMQNPEYAERFRRLVSICAAKNVALQAIKAICRRPWREGAEHTHATWYEPLTGPEDIALAVRFVLAQPSFFLNTAGDLRLLPLILDAAGKEPKPPADREMRRLVEAQAMEPLW